MPPLYGDVPIRIEGKEEEIEKFEMEKEKRGEVERMVLMKREKRWMGLEKDPSIVEEGDVKMEEDGMISDDDLEKKALTLLLEGDVQDEPVLKSIREYEVGYDRMVVTPTGTTAKDSTPNTTTTTTNPLANTTDTHQVNEEGTYTLHPMTNRIPYTTKSTPYNHLPPKERWREWQRWNKEMNLGLEEQIRFGDGELIFDLKKRLEVEATKKEKSEERKDESPRGKVLRRKSAFDSTEEEEENRGRGKVLKREKEEDTMEIEKETKNEEDSPASKDDKEMVSEPNENSKNQTSSSLLKKRHNRTFSLRPHPSFHTQDLHRFHLLHQNLLHHTNQHSLIANYKSAQSTYDTAFQTSMKLQQEKAAVYAEYQKIIQNNKMDLQNRKLAAEKRVERSKTGWRNMQHTVHRYRENYGEEALSIRLTSRGVVKDLLDRVVVRNGGENPTGTGYLRHCMRREEKGSEKYTVLSVLGSVVDAVDRRYSDYADLNPTYIPPLVENEHNTICDFRTQETVAEKMQRMQTQYKEKVERVNQRFETAEKNRAAAWNEVVKYKSMMGGDGSSSKVKRSRKATTSRAPVRPQQQQVDPRRLAEYRRFNEEQAQRARPQMQMPMGRPVQGVNRAPMRVQNVSVPMAPPTVQASAYNRVVVQSASAAAVDRGSDGDGRMTQNAKYAYGDR